MSSDTDIAERLTRRRANVMTIFALLLMSTQGLSIGAAERVGLLGGGAARTVDIVYLAAWLTMVAALLILLLTGGGLLRSAGMRRLLDDETTRDNRGRALTLGFVNAMATGLLIYLLTFFKAADARLAVHIVLTVGMASALLSFGHYERQALKGG